MITSFGFAAFVGNVVVPMQSTMKSSGLKSSG